MGSWYNLVGNSQGIRGDLNVPVSVRDCVPERKGCERALTSHKRRCFCSLIRLYPVSRGADLKITT